MAKRDAGKLFNQRNSRLIAYSMLALAFALAMLCVNGTLTPMRYDLTVGEAATATIYAPSEAIDTVSTEILKQKARKETESVLSIDTAGIAQYKTDARAFFAAVDSLGTKAAAYIAPDETVPVSFEEWDMALDGQEKITLCALTVPRIDSQTLLAVLCAQPKELQTIKEETLSRLDTVLDGGVSEEGRDKLIESCTKEINGISSIPSGLRKLAALTFENYLNPTLSLDGDATEAAYAQAIADVEPIVVKKGQLVVEKGSIVTDAQYALLRDMGLLSGGEHTAKFNMGIFLAVFTLFVLFGAYMRLYQNSVLTKLKSMAVIALLIAVSSALTYLANMVDYRFTSLLLPVLLCALLVNESCAMSLNVLLSLLFGIMAGGAGTGSISSHSAVMIICNVSAGFVAVGALKQAQSRAKIIAAGAAGGAYASVVAVALELMQKTEFWGIAESVAWIFGSAMVCVLLVTGSLSIWETLFDVATPARLNELSNTNNPLLRQLMTEAPGTYQHSIMVGALAEGAAQKIGADALLARVGAYYHDVGKLRRPQYFKENQKNGENIHDTLPPLESAQTIISHQKDGVTLLTRHKLPSAVIKICSEHHGNALMTYFYYKAKQADGNLPQKGFRYSGNRPTTKESAIVMMADGCEAAVRSLGDTNSADVEQMVHKIIWGKLNENENMMSNAPLTIAEISEIEKSFLKTFAGIMHDRIEYPDMEANK